MLVEPDSDEPEPRRIYGKPQPGESTEDFLERFTQRILEMAREQQD
jgi:broad specificity phosphatase PhoE